MKVANIIYPQGPRENKNQIEKWVIIKKYKNEKYLLKRLVYIIIGSYHIAGIAFFFLKQYIQLNAQPNKIILDLLKKFKSIDRLVINFH